MTMLKLIVGQEVPRCFWRKNAAPAHDGSAFDLAEDGTPFIFVYLREMTREEAWYISEYKFDSAYWHSHGFWLGMLKIGEMLLQLSFDPMVHYLNYGSFSPDLFQENRVVTFVGIDAADMTIKALRAATYPWKFLESLHAAFGEFSPHDGYSSRYKGVIEEFNQQPIWLCWEKLTPGGFFGEKKNGKK
jgi:hypothetical protein